MIKSEQAIIKFDFHDGRAYPDQLRKGKHDHYARAASAMLSVYQRGSGRTRQDLHQRIEGILSRLPDCPPRRVAAFCKLLDDRSVFQANSKQARRIRRYVYELGAQMHPLVSARQTILEHSVEDARCRLESELGMSWPNIERLMFSDIIELQSLESFESFAKPEDLLSWYNVAQAQACLYRASKMTIYARDDFKVILRHAKLAGLMHRVHRVTHPPGYEFYLDGPATVLRETWRYGVRFARLLPKLLACRHWRMEAEISGPGNQRFRYELDHNQGLRSPLAEPEEFDSEWEKAISSAWQESHPAGWSLARESEIVVSRQQVFTPDFVLTRDGDSRAVHVELVGYWTPQYLRDKAEKLRQLHQALTVRGEQPLWILIFPKRAQQPLIETEQWPDVPFLELGSRFVPDELVSIAKGLLENDCPTDKETLGR